MITTLLSVVGPLLLPILGGVLSGAGINIVGAIAGTSRAKLVVLAVRLAIKFLRGQADQADAESVIASADPWMIERAERDLGIAVDAIIPNRPPVNTADPEPDHLRSKAYQRMMKQLRTGEFEIVSSNELSGLAIAKAQADGRFFADDDGFGYALVKKGDQRAANDGADA